MSCCEIYCEHSIQPLKCSQSCAVTFINWLRNKDYNGNCAFNWFRQKKVVYKKLKLNVFVDKNLCDFGIFAHM